MLKAVLAPEPDQYRHLRETLIGESFDALTCVAMTGDGRRIIAGTLSGELRSWRASDHALMIALKAQTGEVTEVRSLEGHVGGVRRVALSADARLLVFRSHVRDRQADGGDTDGPNWTPAAA
jgi:hypothetical protein